MGAATIPESELGVLVKPLVTGLSGSSYNYVSKSVGGKKSKKSRKSTKKARKSAKKSRKSAKKWFPMLGF